MKEMNASTKGKCPKQDLTSSEGQPIGLPEGRESPYHRLDLLTFLT